MDDRSTRRHLAVTGLATVLAVLGAWLPWVQRVPPAELAAGDDLAAYTLVVLPQLEAGFTTLDVLVVASALAAVCVGVVARSRLPTWGTDGALTVTGGALLLVAGDGLLQYTDLVGYRAAPGLFLVFAAGLLLLLTGGGGALLGRARRRSSALA